MRRVRLVGFTLIELLVVIAVIALLVTILLPSLNRAKDLARSAVCRVHLQAAAKAQRIYSSEYGGYLAGPNGSGYALRQSLLAGGRPDPNWFVGSDRPIQFDDWMSPIIGETRDLPEERSRRVIALFNDEFRCPANDLEYTKIYGETHDEWWPDLDKEPISFNSYSAPITLHAFSNLAHARKKGKPYAYYLRGHDEGVVDISTSNYDGRIESIGEEALKACAMDGSRYIKQANEDDKPICDFNADPYSTSWPQTFMNRGPGLNAYYQNNGNPYKFEEDNRNNRNLHWMSEKYSYRHPDNTMNISFMDGHVENCANERSRTAGFWFPSGSTVLDIGNLSDLNAQKGDVID